MASKSKSLPTKGSKTKRITSTSDVSNTSGDEVSMLMLELDEIKKKTVSKDDIKDIVSSIVKEMLIGAKEVMEKQFEEFKKEQDKVRNDLAKRIDRLQNENHVLKESVAEKAKQIREMEQIVKETSKMAKKADSKANFNEQYSRKCNVKIFGLQEVEKENTQNLVQSMLKDVAKITLREEDIVAVHRIPGGRRSGPRPVLLKVKNSEVKAVIMRKRSAVKGHGHLRLADDVTESNSKLIQRLKEHSLIEQAYYFNGHVYGRTKDGSQRIRFDINDDLAKKIQKKSSGSMADYDTSDSE